MFDPNVTKTLHVHLDHRAFSFKTFTTHAVLDIITVFLWKWWVALFSPNDCLIAHYLLYKWDFDSLLSWPFVNFNYYPNSWSPVFSECYNNLRYCSKGMHLLRLHWFPSKVWLLWATVGLATLNFSQTRQSRITDDWSSLCEPQYL